jgi:protein phosphatase
MTATTESDTAELVVAPNPVRDRPEAYSSLVQADLAGLSNTGLVRENNEDHFLICRFGRYLEAVQSNLPADTVPARSDEVGFGMAVADGMGGMAAGEEASRAALSGLVNLVLHTPDWILRVDESPSPDEIQRRTAERLEKVNETMAAAAEEDNRLRGYGTTLTLAASLGRELFVTHVGDSRAYLWRRGKLRRLTRDHTMAEVLADAKQIERQEVATHRLRHVLTKFLGDHHRPVAPDVSRMPLEDDDRLLLCTDGLNEMVPEEVIGELMAADEPAELVCRWLVDRALTGGGKDNVTVVVAKYRLPK